MPEKRPVLYSFRRCPYAIRARMAIAYAGIQVELREVLLREKPATMLALSPKGTVPVLQLGNGQVIDESIDIMRWALSVRDLEGWLDRCTAPSGDGLSFIEWNDGEFKYYLDRYKYADRFPAYDPAYYRSKAVHFLRALEIRLVHSRFLAGRCATFADIAIFPFIRQFAAVDRNWFDASAYIGVARWVREISEGDLFCRIMEKYPRWNAEENNGVLFGDDA